MTSNRPSVADKRRTFRQLHESGCFVIPNPWDIGSAKFLQSLGFKALASTSAGFAWSRGHADNQVTRDMVLAHLRELVDATNVPINADFESGFASDAAGVRESVRLAVDTGVAGLSIEDSTGNKDQPLYPLDTAVERIRAARKAIDQSGADVLLVGRCEAFLVGKPDISETIARLQAYSNAGADCLYAPLLKTREHVMAAVVAVAPKPLNLLMGWPGEWSVADIAAMGVRRISVGGALASAAYSKFMEAAREIASEGSFAGLTGTAGKELNPLFRTIT